jgi:hypothetical protein
MTLFLSRQMGRLYGMKHMWARIAAKIADAGGAFIHGGCQIFCRETAGGKGFLLEVVILAIEAVERAGLVEDGQVGIPVFRTFFVGISGRPASRASWTHKAGHAIGGQGIVIKGQVPLVGPPPFQPAAANLPKPAKTDLALADTACVDTDITTDPLRMPRGDLWQAIGIAASGVNRGNLWPHLIEMASDAIGTEAHGVGNGFSALMAVTTCAHGS